RPELLGLIWCAVLLLAAAASRTVHRWGPHARSLSVRRARQYVGALLFIVPAFCLTWRLISGALGFGEHYPLPQPFDGIIAGSVLLLVITTVAFTFLLNVPLAGWILRLVARSREKQRHLSTRETLHAVQIEPSPWALIEQYDEDGQASAGVEAAGRMDAVKKPRVGADNRLVARTTTEKSSGTVSAEGPPIDIFLNAPKAPSVPLDLEHKAERIQETLASFNVAARVVGHHCGPVVTQFDIQPERGVKVRRITELQNDLALALAAPTIRIQAPVPGKPVVGIEIPNTSTTIVSLRELLESDAYTQAEVPLKVALGKDVAGKPWVIDLAKMPHLLIAGATGSGKSACVNAIISCLLYHNRPEDVRLLMIDPKMVELTVYNGIPHLLSTVVTEMEKVVGVLQWALREMERRYKLFANNSVRNITRYNEKMGAAGVAKLPYIVLIVDELADLMMVAPEDVEDAICRLAQLARAAGIHLIIATQRPSVDVVTGLIKANFPARIAFAMTSQVDSRTILDTVGAEKLLGRGDMLYQPPDAPKPIRLQGAFLSDPEIERLAEFWRAQPAGGQVPVVPPEEFVAAEKAAADAGDELLDEATRVVREYQHASVSLLQRRLKVGYARAARLMDQLEERSIVGAADGNKQRPVLQGNDERADVMS
ncbi:MAG TPA: DNA translocase FtsK, partial [Chloroflexota bacterium]